MNYYDNRYTVEYAVYRNCHIVGHEEHKIFATNDDKAWEKAETLGTKLEEAYELMEERADTDYWLEICDLYEDE